MTRRTLICALLMLASGGAVSQGSEATLRPDIRLDARDSEQDLVRKLDRALVGQPVAELAARLAALGARRVGVDIDPHATWPVSAIFGLRQGWLRQDRRVRIHWDRNPDGTVGRVADMTFYTK